MGKRNLLKLELSICLSPQPLPQLAKWRKRVGLFPFPDPQLLR